MGSLADELSAAMAGNGECTVSTPTIQNKSSENNQNTINTSRTSGNSSFISGSQQNKKVHTPLFNTNILTEQNPHAFDMSGDMDITCDVTMPVLSEMYSAYNHELVSSTIISSQDVMDDTMAANAGQSSYSNDTCTISNTETTNAKSCENITSDNDTMSKSISEQSFNNDIEQHQGNSEQTPCIWSHIDTDFDTDEETANFGTRYALENDGKLFDVFTYATIEPKVS
jgi:hypothetical protein